MTELRIKADRPDFTGLGKPLKDWLPQVIGWVVAALLAYGAVEARVRVLEDRYERIKEDLSEIKSDVKALRSYR